jgi:hypothetical protein
MQKKFTSLIFILLVAIVGLQAQNLILKTKGGTEQIKPLGSLKKITFSNNNLLVNYLSGPAETYSLSTISKLYFKSTVTGTSSIALNSEARILSIYPNPVNNVIYIQNAPEEISTVLIYRLDGVKVLQAQISEGNSCIQAGTLAKGLYLLKLNNQAIKFIKL